MQDLRLDVFKLGQLGFAHIVHADHVVAELRFHRRLAGLSLAQSHHGVGKLFDIGAGRGPVQLAALGAGAGVFGRLLGDGVKLAAFFQLGNDFLGLVFLFNQDVARFVFLAGVGGGKLVVFRLHVGFRRRIVLLELRHHIVDQQVLAYQFHLGFEFVAGVQAALLAFLADDLEQHQAVLELGYRVRWSRATGALHLPQHGVQAAAGNRLAVDDGDVLRHGADAATGNQQSDGGAGEVRFHAKSLSGRETERREGNSLGWWFAAGSGQNLNGQRVHATLRKPLQGIIHKAVARHPAQAGKQR